MYIINLYDDDDDDSDDKCVEWSAWKRFYTISCFRSLYCDASAIGLRTLAYHYVHFAPLRSLANNEDNSYHQKVAELFVLSFRSIFIYIQTFTAK